MHLYRGAPLSFPARSCSYGIQVDTGRTRKKLSGDGNKQVKIREEVRLLNIPGYGKIWNDYAVAAGLAET